MVRIEVPLYCGQHSSTLSASQSLRGLHPRASPERVAQEEVDDDDEEYPRFLFLFLFEEAQQSLGHDLGCNSIDFSSPKSILSDV